MRSSGKLPGLIVVISSPSGTGKTTICRELQKSHGDFSFSVSATTRSPRPKEKKGIDYHFITEDRFASMRKKGEFAEWAGVFGFSYGTPMSEINKALTADRVLLCDLDYQGGISIKKKFPAAVTIFIIPPSLTELRSRLFKRRTESPEQKRLRLAAAVKELGYWKKYDYVVLNDDLKKAINEVDMIIAAERSKTSRRNNRRFWQRPQARLLGL